MFPIKNHTQFKFGYKHGDKTFYSDFHLGYDLICPAGTELLMPFDGEVIYKPGEQSGECAWVRFDKEHPGITHRFMHLKKYRIKTGRRKEGERIAFTGNTGLSEIPHLHHDSYKGLNPNPNYRTNFVDPLKLSWEPVPQKLAIRQNVILSKLKNESFITEALNEAVGFINNATGGQMVVIPTITGSQATFTSYTSYKEQATHRQLHDMVRWDQIAAEAHPAFTYATLLYDPLEVQPEVPFSNFATALGGKVLHQVVCPLPGPGSEIWVKADMIVHEWLHGWYHRLRTLGVNLADEFHNYAGIQDPTDKNYKFLIQKLKPHWHLIADGKGEPMIVFKSMDAADKTRYVMQGETLVGFADVEAYNKHIAGREVHEARISAEDLARLPKSPNVFRR